MLFPAKLQVVADSKVWFFSRAEDAWDWLEHRPKVKESGGLPGTPVAKNRRQRKSGSPAQEAIKAAQDSVASPGGAQGDRSQNVDW